MMGRGGYGLFKSTQRFIMNAALLRDKSSDIVASIASSLFFSHYDCLLTIKSVSTIAISCSIIALQDSGFFEPKRCWLSNSS